MTTLTACPPPLDRAIAYIKCAKAILSDPTQYAPEDVQTACQVIRAWSTDPTWLFRADELFDAPEAVQPEVRGNWLWGYVVPLCGPSVAVLIALMVAEWMR